jgi:hypothetical protein
MRAFDMGMRPIKRARLAYMVAESSYLLYDNQH